MSNKNNHLINSIIGEGSRFNGDISMSGLLRIDGDFTGTISINGKVLIGRTGRAECNIHADTIVIGGAVKGDVFSNGKVILLSTGMVLGNIYAPYLSTEEGALFQGNSFINKEKPVQAHETSRIQGRNYKPDWDKPQSYSSL